MHAVTPGPDHAPLPPEDDVAAVPGPYQDLHALDDAEAAILAAFVAELPPSCEGVVVDGMWLGCSTKRAATAAMAVTALAGADIMWLVADQLAGIFGGA